MMLLYERRSFRPVTLDTTIRPFIDTGSCEKCRPLALALQDPWQDKTPSDDPTLACVHTNQLHFHHFAFTTLSKLYSFQALCYDPISSTYQYPSHLDRPLYYGGLIHNLCMHLRRIKEYIEVCNSVSPYSISTQEVTKEFQITEKGTEVDYKSTEGYVVTTTKSYFNSNINKHIKRKRDDCKYTSIVLDQQTHLVMFADWLETQLIDHFKKIPRPSLPSFDSLLGALNTDQYYYKQKQSQRYCALDCLLNAWVVHPKRRRRLVNNKMVETTEIKGCSYVSSKDLVHLWKGHKPMFQNSYSHSINTPTKKRLFVDFLQKYNYDFDYNKFSLFTIPEDGALFQTFLQSQEENYLWCMSF